MIGAIIGDIVGSRFEWKKIKRKEFEFLNSNCFFTDDSVMTIAVCDAIMGHEKDEDKNLKRRLINSMKRLGIAHPDCGYGFRFMQWIFSKDNKPYNSFGNGSAMRVSSCGWLGSSLEEVQRLARLSAEVTHNHSEGIKGAVAVASAIYMLRTGSSKEEVKRYIKKNFYNNINRKLDDIRPGYSFDVTCQGSVPESFMCFFQGKDFEDTIRNAISLGGDSDTIAAIAGSMAEAYYGVKEDLEKDILEFLTDDLKKIYFKFKEKKDLIE